MKETIPDILAAIANTIPDILAAIAIGIGLAVLLASWWST